MENIKGNIWLQKKKELHAQKSLKIKFAHRSSFFKYLCYDYPYVPYSSCRPHNSQLQWCHPLPTHPVRRNGGPGAKTTIITVQDPIESTEYTVCQVFCPVVRMPPPPCKRVLIPSPLRKFSRNSACFAERKTLRTPFRALPQKIKKTRNSVANHFIEKENTGNFVTLFRTIPWKIKMLRIPRRIISQKR
jgi:hypothetical protein